MLSLLKRIKWILLGLTLSSALSMHAQKNDYIWSTGYESVGGGFDTSCQCWFGDSKFDFNQSTVRFTHDTLGIDFNFTNEAISDSNGQLLFYSNAVMVYNFANELVSDGDSLGWGPFFTYVDQNAFLEGMPYSQMLLTLPNPQMQNVYDLFYIYIDTLNAFDVLPNKLLRARVDMNKNGGLGSVTEKDVVVLEQSNDLTITSVRHGNGRDWWLCTNEVPTNCHDIFLYTGSDTLQAISQCSGMISPFGDAHACRFSPDGNFYITTNDSGQINVFNFDRCTGAISLREEFVIPEIADSFQWWPTGLEFSPDSRFFYIFCSARIFQYDLTNSPIVDSKDTIASYHYPGHYPADYFWGQLAPDGKIYVSGGSGSPYISIIDSPDVKGGACKFLDQSVEIPSFIMGLPYYPNYRLGPLTQSQCDSLSTSTQEVRDAKEQILKVFPNPASDIATVDYGFTDWNKGAVSLEITNALGQVVYTQPLPIYSGYQRLDISRFAAGMYTVCIKRNGGVVASQKLVKQ